MLGEAVGIESKTNMFKVDLSGLQYTNAHLQPMTGIIDIPEPFMTSQRAAFWNKVEKPTKTEMKRTDSPISNNTLLSEYTAVIFSPASSTLQ